MKKEKERNLKDKCERTVERTKKGEEKEISKKWKIIHHQRRKKKEGERCSVKKKCTEGLNRKHYLHG